MQYLSGFSSSVLVESPPEPQFQQTSTIAGVQTQDTDVCSVHPSDFLQNRAGGYPGAECWSLGTCSWAANEYRTFPKDRDQ
mmetsp:Transcript_37051/g.147857  ORF Transcript_37051/g.147857 Transcript_37051/m.147857 type:complete len:81 (-) Transcript_37051:90-332(-)